MRAHRHVDGFTLIEVLVALLILAFGILGMLKLQADSIAGSSAAEDRARAVQLAANAAALMWTAKSANLSTAQITAWQATVSTTNNPGGGLPSGSGSIGYDATNHYAVITLKWTEPNGGSAHQYQTVVQIPTPP